jgi:hypothetical protein
MPAHPKCSVCASPNRNKIDLAIREGRSDRSIGRDLGVGRTALRNHALAHVTGLPTGRRPAARGGRPRGPGNAPSAVTEAVALDTPAQVMVEFASLYAESRAALEGAKATGDLVRIGKALDLCASILDRHAKAQGIFTDGTIVNVDASTRKLEVAIAGLSTEQLRELVAGGVRALQTAPVIEELAS